LIKYPPVEAVADCDAESELKYEEGFDCAVSCIVVAACAACALGEMRADGLAVPLDAVLMACDAKTITVDGAADSSPDDVVLVELLSPSQGTDPSSPGSPEIVSFEEGPPSFAVAAAPTPLVTVLFELSCPVRPPETPVACILASASVWESHTIDVPALLTRGRAKHEVPAEHALTCHWPLTHWANDPAMQPFSPPAEYNLNWRYVSR
jgi:hypothetical protein